MGAAVESPLPEHTWDTLRSRFKQLQQQTNNVHQNWQIRVHRSLSWHKRAVALPEDQLEAKFILLWVSLNSLYARWDLGRNAPAHDAAARRAFLARICGWDSVLVERMLRQHRPLVKKLLSDPFLSDAFWRDPFNPKSKGWGAADANYLEANLRAGEYCKLLGQLADRLYVLRGQLVHGASTGGGRLNRRPLTTGLQFLTAIVPFLIHVVLERGCHDDWPELCYPPIK